MGRSREVRRQTCDLISLMEAGTPDSEHYMFMEDDFRHEEVLLETQSLGKPILTSDNCSAGFALG